MNINSAALIFFSPTGSTRKILNAIVNGLGVQTVKSFDLTSPDVRNARVSSIKEDIVIIGVPVYKDMIPKLLVPYLESLQGNRKPAVLVTVYGNIDDGIALNELYSIEEKAGFRVIAAGSFVAEHSFSSDVLPIAKGRPTEEDLHKAEEFGIGIKRKLQGEEIFDLPTLNIPAKKLSVLGRILPENVTRMLAKTPAVGASGCNRCGICAMHCPVSAIDMDTLKIDESKCLRCFLCVKRCNSRARSIEFKKRLLVTRFFSYKSRAEHEPKVYF